MTKPAYSTTARVTGGRGGGRAAITTGELAVELQLPKELGGPGGATNPEQLFAIGYAACFESVLGIVGKAHERRGRRRRHPFDGGADPDR